MASTSPEPAATETGDSVKIRRLEIADRERGFLSLLSQLSSCPDLTESEFAACFADLAALGDDHVILVAEDPAAAPERRILSTGCLFVERKFLRGGGKIAKEAGCYKVILDCTPELRAYYAKCGFVEKGVQMAVYF
ncbi:unnamed protein product [Triticum turgidum subsp. durum]|uniref:Glucosamine 6-phosphate N-acetyltransferase n=1 Tax=Triticum turgidum subsp. durum TaxID=4567 RepID=A0A9R0YSE7_TRITD|nr:unnamed protein product [Triticum turgidum subsp. durum]